MLQNATDLDLTAFVGVGLGEGSWEAFCKNSIISRQIVETTAKDFAGTNPRHETVYTGIRILRIQWPGCLPFT